MAAAAKQLASSAWQVGAPQLQRASTAGALATRDAVMPAASVPRARGVDAAPAPISASSSMTGAGVREAAPSAAALLSERDDGTAGAGVATWLTTWSLSAVASPVATTARIVASMWTRDPAAIVKAPSASGLWSATSGAFCRRRSRTASDGLAAGDLVSHTRDAEGGSAAEGEAEAEGGAGVGEASDSSCHRTDGGCSPTFGRRSRTRPASPTMVGRAHAAAAALAAVRSPLRLQRLAAGGNEDDVATREHAAQKLLTTRHATTHSTAQSARRDGSDDDDAARRGDSSEAPTFLVYLVKRPLTETAYSKQLKALGQEHVGVRIVSFDAVPLKGVGATGGADIGDDDAAHSLTLDFGPSNGTDFKLFGSAPAEIRLNCPSFAPGAKGAECAFLAESTRTRGELAAFNAAFKKEYQLGLRDCRDYSAALVSFLCGGLRIRPSHIAAYVDNAKPVAQLVQRTPAPAHELPEDHAAASDGAATTSSSSSAVEWVASTAAKLRRSLSLDSLVAAGCRAVDDSGKAAGPSLRGVGRSAVAATAAVL